MKGSDNSSKGNDKPTPSRATSATLLARVLNGEREGWERLMQLYQPLVRWKCRCIVACQQVAEDIAQEVFLTVFQKIGSFDREQLGSFRKWLRGITHNKIGDYLRKAGNQPLAAGGTAANALLAELPDAPDGDPEEARTERALLLRGAMELVRSEFEPKTWEAAWKTAVEGKSAAEVAGALGMTPGAVYIAKSRVLARLREETAGLLDS